MIEIKPYNDDYKEQVVTLWEKSVRATHDFLIPSDFEEIKELVKNLDFNALAVFCLVHQSSVIGFIGVIENKVEMLFLSPDFFGKGLGKKLMNFAIKELNADKVDVNEQNKHAVGFYTKSGFEMYERTKKDVQGRNYPILKMNLPEVPGS